MTIDRIESEVVNGQHSECFIGNVGGDDAVVADLGDVTDAFEKAVCDARCFSGTCGDGVSGGGVDVEIEDCCAASNDLGHVVVGVEVEVEGASETVAKWGREEGKARGGADDGEGLEIEAECAS